MQSQNSRMENKNCNSKHEETTQRYKEYNEIIRNQK